MANKVLSIKMDEKDIKRLKKYYETLINMGFLTSSKTSLNAFYKHLLLDYLEEDLSKAFAIYSNYGIAPRFIDPEKLNVDNRFSLTNTYNLDAEMFENYEKCVKESISKKIDDMKESVEILKEVTNADVIIINNWMYEMEYLPKDEMNEENSAFWENRAVEIIDLQEKHLQENNINGEIEMIKKSSIPEGLKQKLINEMNEYEKKRKQNYRLMQGREIRD